MPDTHTRHIVGVMTGTSIDALDAALVRVDGRGLDIRASLVRASTTPLADLATPLRALAEQSPASAGEIARLARDFSLLHARAIADLLAGDHADLLVIHGQTIFHSPPVSWQLLAPAVIAHHLRATVVFDLRAADLAAGGQGAPITPIADWVLFRDPDERRAVANLGGFVNLTTLPARSADPAAPPGVSGRDLCMGNHLLDTIARRLLGVPFDAGGAAALAADPDPDALDDLIGVLTAQSGAKRSLGTGDDDAMSWIGRHRARLSGATLAASACEAIAQSIARHIEADRLLLAGGGVHNAALLRAITSCCSCRVDPTDRLGVPAAFREAIAMAVLGALAQDRVPLTLSAVTGAPVPPVAGIWVFP